MSTAPVRTGIVGCGMVAVEYAQTLAAANGIKLGVCADLDGARAQSFADHHRITAVPVDHALDPAMLDLALILTPPSTHAALARQAIAAGLRAVWIEKPFTTDPEDATALLQLAQRTGTLIGVAPDTLLGPAIQTASEALKQNLVGDVLSATASLFSTGPEGWHPSPEPFYSEHVGPLGDMGPYYLTALDYLLGPLHVRSAISRTRSDRRVGSGPHAGRLFTAQAPTYVTALLDTDTGTPITLITSFDAAGSRAPHLEIHGTDGTLVLPDPNAHDGQVLYLPYGQRTWTPLRPAPSSGPSSRGLGVLDLADALHKAHEPQCSAPRAERIVHLIGAIIRATALSTTAPSTTRSRIPTAPYPRRVRTDNGGSSDRE